MPRSPDKQLALMDEDHTFMQTPASCSSYSVETARAASPSNPSCGRVGSSPSSCVDSTSAYLGLESHGKGRRGGGVASGVVEAVGGREMACIDAVDLGDIVGVHQEESAPEQVTVNTWYSACFCGV